MKPATEEKNAHDGVFGTDAEDRKTITFERYFDHSIESVWHAITDSEAGKGWLGMLEVEPKVGGRYAMRLDGTDLDGHVSEGRVIAYQAPTLLECTLGMEGQSDENVQHVLRWELEPNDDGCKLMFRNTFGRGERARNSIVCGWHGKLEQIIDTVEGKPLDWTNFDHDLARERIVELYCRYRSKPQV